MRVHCLANKDVESAKERLAKGPIAATKGLQCEEDDNNTRLQFGAKPGRGHIMRKDIFMKDIVGCEKELELIDSLPAPISRVIVSAGRSIVERDGLAPIIDQGSVEVEQTSSPI